MNWSQFKDPVSHMCLAGALLASRSLTQEMAGSDPFSVMTNIFITEYSVKRFRENSINTNLLCTISNNIQVYENPVPRTKKIPHCVVKLEAGGEQNCVMFCNGLSSQQLEIIF